jgi:hypothetical protein
MHQSLAILTFDTDGQGFREITDDVNSWLRATDVRMGQVTLFCQHTSASLLITENAAPAVKLIPWPSYPRRAHASPQQAPARANVTTFVVALP